MTEEIDIVEGLRKVVVTIEAVAEAGGAGSGPPPKTAEFIFGIGTEGLTPLEAEIAGKRVGDAVSVSIPRPRIPAAAGHLCRHMPQVSQGDGPVLFRIRIDDIRRADNREIVRAMAELGGCSEGCCGGH